MKEMRTTNDTKNKGITLIALIITIIVMLILVAVTINMAINGGLFEKSGQAVGETKNEINKEKELANGRVKIDGIWYDSIGDYQNGTQSADQGNGTEGGDEPTAVHSWTRTGDTFTCSHCNTTYEMGQKVNYTATGASSTTITAEKSGLDKYLTEKGSYPTDANVDENGVQTIEPQTTNWVVLGIEDTDGDGEVYETLLITTGKPVEVATDKKLWLCGIAAYNNGPDEINRTCEKLYSNNEYGKARGMTIEDVNSALKYVPDGSSEENGYYYYLNSDGTEILNSGGTTISTVTTAEKNIVFGTYNDYKCVLASRGKNGDTSFGCAHVSFNTVTSWGLGAVFEEFGGWFGSNIAHDDNDISNWDGTSFRPVVTLTNELPASAS
ncbi:MAG: hypothetical protein ACI4U9_00460 [Clostridia bacterium]